MENRGFGTDRVMRRKLSHDTSFALVLVATVFVFIMIGLLLFGLTAGMAVAWYVGLVARRRWTKIVALTGLGLYLVALPVNWFVGGEAPFGFVLGGTLMMIAALYASLPPREQRSKHFREWLNREFATKPESKPEI